MGIFQGLIGRCAVEGLLPVDRHPGGEWLGGQTLLRQAGWRCLESGFPKAVPCACFVS